MSNVVSLGSSQTQPLTDFVNSYHRRLLGCMHTILTFQGLEASSRATVQAIAFEGYAIRVPLYEFKFTFPIHWNPNQEIGTLQYQLVRLEELLETLYL